MQKKNNPFQPNSAQQTVAPETAAVMPPIPEPPTPVIYNNQMKMPPGFAKGGMLAEGGMLQEGGSVDPVSGNEVPTGSLKEEVRDDIPAKISEGEFIFPADVVRYIGLDRLMKLRQGAKQGLAKMDAMGQMSNADEATMEDDAEFESEIDEIVSGVEEEEREYATGVL
jgi:hypothetical protein